MSSLLSNLQVKKGAVTRRKRIGRGPGSGHGKTATRGHKGKKARTHGVVPRGYEGGQMPLHRRLPKFGFTPVFRTKYSVVNTERLAKFQGDVNPETLVQAGLVREGWPVKILGRGGLTTKLNVKAHKFSEKAKQLIKAAGGNFEEIK